MKDIEGLRKEKAPEGLAQITDSFYESVEDTYDPRPEDGDIFDGFETDIEIANLKSIPKAERNKKILEIRENLEKQKRGISEIILALKEEIHIRPDATLLELQDLVSVMAVKSRLSLTQIANFNSALRSYEIKHRAVVNYREKFKDDRELFEACFGFAPKGKAEVITGPITLHFRCYDDTDYVEACNWDSEKDENGKTTKEDIKEDATSSGVAIHDVKLEELKNAVTLGRMSSYSDAMEGVTIEKKTEIINGSKTLDLFEQEGDIEIRDRAGKRWKLKLSEETDSGEYLRLTLVSLDNEDDKPLFDLRKIKDEKGEDVGLENLLRGNKIEDSFSVDLSPDRSESLCIDVDPFTVRIYGQEIEVKNLESELTDVYDEEESEATRLHEEQHQFNKLFEPIAGQSQFKEVLVVANKKFGTNVLGAINYVAHWLVKQERVHEWGIDGMARDEILAFYREGYTTEEIYESMTDPEFYDYFADCKEEIEKDLPTEINEKINESIKSFYPLRSVNLTTEDLRPVIEHVFVTEYKEDLKDWIKAIKDIEAKGYSRDEILSYLAQEPVATWRKLADRLAPKKKTEKVESNSTLEEKK